jgi:hypothetical protein
MLNVEFWRRFKAKGAMPCPTILAELALIDLFRTDIFQGVSNLRINSMLIASSVVY